MIELSRRTFLTRATTATLLPRAARAATAPRPNILWVSCEDISPHIGCYGDRHAITPNIDRLATKGVRFSRAYTVAGVCAPSRSGIITGMYPSTLGSCFMRCRATLPDFVKCFPEYLREAGYYCTNNVKTDYNFNPPKSAWDEVSNKAHWKNRPQGRPFFAVYNFVTTHESQVRLRGEAYDRMTARLTAAQRRDPKALDLPPYYPDTPVARRDWANYYELITAMDYQVGDRLQEIQDAGLLEDTIVFFWSDHGVGLPRAKRWLYESSTHVPLVVRIPEKFRTAVQGSPGSVDEQLVSFLDLAPTVLNLAGVPVPKHMQGRAFLGPNLTPPREHIFGARDRMDERYDITRMVRDKRYRYLRNYEPHKPYAQHTSYMEEGYIMKELRRLQKDGNLPAAARLYMGDHKPVEELYDVERDPHELHNLASSPGHKPVLERLRAVHEKWSLETRDLGLIPEPEIVEREQKLGSRYAILQQPASQQYLKRLRALVEAVNRGTSSALVAKAFDDPDAAFRYWAIVGLAHNARSNQERLLKALSDSSPVVRIAAARATKTLPILIQELKSPQEVVRLHAAIALDELGKNALPARDALREAAKEETNYVPRVAEHALRELG